MRGPTSIVDYPPPCPVFDHHSKLSNPRIGLDIYSNHACILKGYCVIHIHIAGEAKLGIPNLDNWNFGG